MAQFIQNKLGGHFVIDIRGGACKPVPSGTPLDAFSKKTTDNCNQLWTLMPPGPEGFSFIQSNLKDESGDDLVIPITRHLALRRLMPTRN